MKLCDIFLSFFLSTNLIFTPSFIKLKNDIELKGTLQSVDQFLNLKLDNISCTDEENIPTFEFCQEYFYKRVHSQVRVSKQEHGRH